MYGTVNPFSEATLPIRIRGPKGLVIDAQAVIDTGFNDWLFLPSSIIKELELEFREEVDYKLADSSSNVTRLFNLDILWFGQWRRVLAIEMDCGPLVGMTLLNRSSVRIDVIDGGRVEIHQLP